MEISILQDNTVDFVNWQLLSTYTDGIVLISVLNSGCFFRLSGCSHTDRRRNSSEDCWHKSRCNWHCKSLYHRVQMLVSFPTTFKSLHEPVVQFSCCIIW